MSSYIVARLLRALVTVFLVLSFAFVILRLSGDPALLIMSPDVPPEAIEAFRRSWGLDASLWEQYLGFFLNLLQGQFGYSMRDGRPAMALPAFALKRAPGMPAGMFAALHRNSAIDRCVMGLAVAGHTIPGFVLGLVLVLVFAVGLGWLPSGGNAGWQHAILPV